jgi:hypothetical protein
MASKKALSSITISASLLLILGVGNLAMGRSKSAYFTRAIENANSPGGDSTTPDLLLIQRLESRKRFYTIVSFGGATFILSGIGLLGFDLIRGRRS